MKDPTRIPAVLAALRTAWEGQPDLELSELWGILQNRCVSWGTTDEQLVEILAQVSAEHPNHLVADAQHLAVIDTVEPRRRVSVAGEWVVVRGPGLVPSAWRFSTLRSSAVGAPLVITNIDGVDVRFGVITGIRRHPMPSPPRELSPGDGTWAVLLEDGSLTMCGHVVDIYRKGRRDVTVTQLRPQRYVLLGEKLVVDGEVVGSVDKVIAVER